MNSSKKTIIFTGIASAILVVITYLETVNIENHFLSINSPWISNNFLLTIIGGAFASMLVVLACEIQKFYATKASTKAFLFYHGTQLYIHLFRMLRNAQDYRHHPEQEIVKTLFDDPIDQAEKEKNALLSADYASFSSNNSLLAGYQTICSELWKTWSTVTAGKRALEVAILEVKIALLEQNQKRPITSGDGKVGAVLTTHEKHVADAMEAVNMFLELFEEENMKKYPWSEMKASMEQSYVSLFDAWNLEKYVEEL